MGGRGRGSAGRWARSLGGGIYTAASIVVQVVAWVVAMIVVKVATGWLAGWAGPDENDDPKCGNASFPPGKAPTSRQE